MAKRAGVPHGRGDEPNCFSGRCAGWPVFPTGVGMNRCLIATSPARDSVPHGRGDEPRPAAASLVLSLCSPRAWG